MKQLVFYCLLLLGLTHPVTAQITITNSVFPAVGETLHYAFGNQPGAINEIFTPPGGNQVWNLSNLQPTQFWNQIMKNPALGSAQASFPGASILYNPLNSASEVYLQVTGTQVLDMGYFGLDELGLGLNLLFDKVPNLELSWAPVNFFDIHQSTSNVLSAFDAPIAPPILINLVPTADSFRIRVTYQRLGVIDAWGTLTIPGGTFDVLRKKQTEYKSTAVDVKVAPLGWIDISTIGGQQILPLGTDTITTFHFLNDVSKEAIAICTLNTAQNEVTGVQYKSINICPTITFTATPTNTCPGSNNGQIVVSGVSGGTAPYMYSIDNEANYQSGATFTGLAANTYQVVVKDANGCTSGATPVVVGTFTPPTCTVTGADFVCNNSPGNVYTAPAGMSAYNWGISGAGSIPGSTTGQSVSVTSGNYIDNYTVFVTITDNNGCTSVCSKLSNIFLFTPPANITVNPNPACFGVTLDLSIAAAASSTVSWSGEGVTDADGNFTPDGFGGFYNKTTAVPTSPGSKTYSVSVTADYGCSNTGSVNVTVNPLPPAPTCPANSTTCLNTPAYALSGASPGGGTYSGPGVSAGMFNPATAGAGTHMITYTVTDGNGCTNTCTFEITVLASCFIDFSGKIIFSNNNSLGVNNATVSLSGSASGSDLSDTNGDFFISTAVSSGSFVLKPAKTVNKLNGVTAGDITAIQQHVANIVLITDPYKLVAADVNKSNTINSLDASIINQSILGNPAALAQFKTSWRFAPTSHVMATPPWGFPEQRTYTNINTSQTNQNFYGIKTGDVATAFANPANFGAGQPLVLRDNDQLLQAGETLVVEFKAEQMDDLAAFQCALRFDPAQLQFVGIEPLNGLPLTTDNIGTYNIAEGEIRLVWAQVTGVAVDEAAPVFRLQFTALQSGAKLSEVLQLDESELPALSYTGALAESKLELKFSELTGTGDPAGAGGVQLLQNRPNPFSGATTIGFVLPEACEAQLRVFDVSGKMLAEKKAQYPAGRYEEIFNLNGATGVLYYELTTPFGVLAKKMVAAEK